MTQPYYKHPQFSKAKFGLVNCGLNKLTEECGELIQVAMKKTQFMDFDEHPDGKGSLKLRLEEEMAHVIAAIHYTSEELELDQDSIMQQAQKKLALYHEWNLRDKQNQHGVE